jgi:transposase
LWYETSNKMPLRKVEISEAEIQAARYEFSHSPCKKVRTRMLVLVLKSRGIKHEEIALVAGISLGTVRNYLNLYEKLGIEGLKKTGYVKPQSELCRHTEAIRAEFAERPPRTAKEAKNRISELTGVHRSRGRVSVFMHKIGMSVRKTGHIPAKADPEKQREFHDKTLLPLIKKCKKGKCHLFFMDSAHFVLAPYVTMVWCFVRTFIPSSAGRFRLNVLAVIHATSKEISGISNDTYVNAETVCTLLRRIAGQYNDLPIYVILDNARYQHCKLVKDLAEELYIKLVFLPPYSPNLNLIERLWKYVKSEVCNARYFQDKSSFEKAILDFLNNTHQQHIANELQSRMTLNFQLFSHRQNQAV